MAVGCRVEEDFFLPRRVLRWITEGEFRKREAIGSVLSGRESDEGGVG